MASCRTLPFDDARRIGAIGGVRWWLCGMHAIISLLAFANLLCLAWEVGMCPCSKNAGLPSPHSTLDPSPQSLGVNKQLGLAQQAFLFACIRFLLNPNLSYACIIDCIQMPRLQWEKFMSLQLFKFIFLGYMYSAGGRRWSGFQITAHAAAKTSYLLLCSDRNKPLFGVVLGFKSYYWTECGRLSSQLSTVLSCINHFRGKYCRII